MMPSWPPSSPMTRISLVRIFSLTLSFFSMSTPPAPDEAGGASAAGAAAGASGTEHPLRLHLQQSIADRPDRHRAEIAFAPAAHGDGSGPGLAIAGDQHEGDLLELGVADLGADLLAAIVELGAQAGRPQIVAHGASVVAGAIGDRKDDGLDRRQPERERSGVMLDEAAHEPLERSEDGPVDHDHRHLGRVGRDVMDSKTLRQVEVELD